jgi:hypothetical protein
MGISTLSEVFSGRGLMFAVTTRQKRAAHPGGSQAKAPPPKG